MAITNARWYTKTGFDSTSSQVLFTDDALGERVVTWSKSKRGLDRLLLGAYEWIQEARATPPTKTIEPYQIPLSVAQREFKNTLDAAVAITNEHVRTKDNILDGLAENWYIHIWPEFFELQRWQDLPAPRPSRPATPLIDVRARAIRYEINKTDPTYTLNNARNLVRRQLNNRRFRIMVEDVDGTGNLVSYSLRQQAMIDGQKEAYQDQFKDINNSADPDDVKANNIEALRLSLLKPNGEIRRLDLDLDETAPIL